MLNDVHSLTFVGTHAGVPIAISLAYQQKINDAVGIDPGEDLVESWFGNVGGPWDLLRALLVEDLVWTCGQSSWADRTSAVFLTGGAGLVLTASLPSTHCIQFNVPAVFPHTLAYEGRFYMPGIPVSAVNRSGFTETMNNALVVAEAAMISIDAAGANQPDAYRLVPHAKYLDEGQSTQQIDAFAPFHDMFVKVIGARRPDGCTAFVGGGGGDFGEFDIPAPPP